MSPSSLTRSIKQAMTEGLKENRDVLRDLLAEVIEDPALANAIREGEKTKRVRKQLVMKALAGRK